MLLPWAVLSAVAVADATVAGASSAPLTYRELAAARRQAIGRARELGLLDG